ncbi:MAG TPA: carboxypeptidase-like regulatory domain-containing protein [Acidobacteriota bacterium]|nr:carboxypeptidase-like regulatory domain-containing protein [Acidobacteriota bacterium]HQQ46184.1 carboxypeptidase-like regulatory domain-containing protein [Acidobacteriota bacterium]
MGSHLAIWHNGSSFDDEINCGWYQFTGLAPGTYTITASKPCYGFTPSSLSVTITNADATEKNFDNVHYFSHISGTLL